MIHGFKELASVCHSIAQGQQTVLLRKAGIRESTHESAFQPKSFYLLPVWFVSLVVAREFLITGIRLVAGQKGAVLAAEKVGKHKTATQ
ncbi:MAG: DUF1802 family protein, partial [Verrucomicrobia bacterium]|nr:DUF1802 family protein [Verrucomicrobiota bacterium]